MKSKKRSYLTVFSLIFFHTICSAASSQSVADGSSTDNDTALINWAQASELPISTLAPDAPDTEMQGLGAFVGPARIFGFGEQGLAENIEWAEKSYGKTMIYAQTGHIMKSRKDVEVGGCRIGMPTAKDSAGEFIAEAYGKSYVLIGGTMDELLDPVTLAPTNQMDGVPFEPTSTCVDCIERPLSQVETTAPYFLLDLRGAQGAALSALNGVRESRFDIGGFQRFNPYMALDGIFYAKRAIPASKTRAHCIQPVDSLRQEGGASIEPRFAK